jgi:uncharacterized protein YggE
MHVSQSIHRPSGINVFGSYVLRVEPDVVLVTFAVSRVESEPGPAFASTRAAVAEVRAYLRKAKVVSADVQTSVVRLVVEHEGHGKDRVFVGYRARVSFSVRLAEIARFEEILAGVVEAGVNQIDNTDFRTTRLAELRADARRGAFAAARRKAELYAEAAGVRVGEVLHVEDVNPDRLGYRESHGADVSLESDEDSSQPSAPGSVQVRAAVMVAFGIERSATPSGFA